ncbi:LOW QUALITY PROTEIN: beta-galactosidase-like [Eriocheir sinensis]|uniref:LOW QUALITY PROTEIN: beta-galactosidase-like n=1 Tax=Eriocheir sinensis TaxID=95602 RepID=UPI0021C5E233|nr:LOW QUALITY PROTEIN: beta-galactosidase-like [Eriocheir sinensis]
MALLAALLTLVALGGAIAEPTQSKVRDDERTFTIDYANNQFLKDGEPFRYVAGSIHYFRVLPSDWRDRLRKMRRAGFNVLQTYVEWASHEPEEGTYNFDGILDLPTFLKTAQEEDLLVILRLGPFADAERDMGGLPYWLLNKNQDMRLRSSDPTDLKYVDGYVTGSPSSSSFLFLPLHSSLPFFLLLIPFFFPSSLLLPFPHPHPVSSYSSFVPSPSFSLSVFSLFLPLLHPPSVSPIRPRFLFPSFSLYPPIQPFVFPFRFLSLPILLFFPSLHPPPPSFFSVPTLPFLPFFSFLFLPFYFSLPSILFLPFLLSLSFLPSSLHPSFLPFPFCFLCHSLLPFHSSLPPFSSLHHLPSLPFLPFPLSLPFLPSSSFHLFPSFSLLLPLSFSPTLLLFPFFLLFLPFPFSSLLSILQVENEYGSYPDCDFAYTSHMRDLVRAGVGDKAVLFTTDGAGVNYLKCGKIPDVYATVDFGPGTDVEAAFEAMRLFEPRGPLVNSEYYPGWLDHWGAPHANVETEAIIKTMDEILALNASVNMYMFHGGTSFGFTAGSNLGSTFQACPTSYDYDAPLSEAGDPTEKYWAIRNLTSKYLPLRAAAGSVFQMADLLQTVTNKWPLTFEQLLVPNGIVVYKTVLPFRIADPARLTLGDIHDRGYVFVDASFAGMVSREQDMYDLAIYARPNQTISIVVESQGRICFGSHINDFKGLTTNATISDHTLENWSMVPLPLTNSKRLASAISRLHRWATSERLPMHRLMGTEKGGMTFYSGSFEVPDNSSHPMDTFLRLDGWNKGIAWVNHFNLGRYWPEVGPQVTLYVPAGVLKQGTNSLLLLEQEAAPCLSPDTCYVTLEDTHVIDGPTPE